MSNNETIVYVYQTNIDFHLTISPFRPEIFVKYIR